MSCGLPAICSSVQNHNTMVTFPLMHLLFFCRLAIIFRSGQNHNCTIMFTLTCYCVLWITCYLQTSSESQLPVITSCHLRTSSESQYHDRIHNTMLVIVFTLTCYCVLWITSHLQIRSESQYHDLIHLKMSSCLVD